MYEYWTYPDITNDPRNKKLTTKHILSHQTGFQNWRWVSGDKRIKFQFDPGAKYQYSGEGFEYLRKALENKLQKSLQQLTGESIFQPLKMHDSRYVWDKYTDMSRYAVNYDKEGNAYETVKNKTPNAADDLVTTNEDYGKFLASVMNSDGLTCIVASEIISNQVASSKGKNFFVWVLKFMI